MAIIYISIGSNVNREQNVKAGLDALALEFGQFNLSSVYESDSVGFTGAPFYNLVVGITTEKDIEIVTKKLREIEFSHGRSKDAKKYSPRTLDLDLLLYDDLILQQPAQIPRDEIIKNAFVLWPLAEIAGDLCHPVLKQNYSSLWKDYDKTQQVIKKVPFHWPDERVDIKGGSK